ncbi:hypothetical protein Golob_002893 [Gossypium lobatum]|uniref:40S ribosomal protein S6 n=1 Tax=Gossypium lobatum TaxID=34289 RepID=A0A7J8N6G4_9ROSI|nr:hypothetical protein [Gossypium lobatum]
MGGCDKQGFPMKQGVLTPGRVRLLLHRGKISTVHSEISGNNDGIGTPCFRGYGRRNGERRRKSVRGCIVSQDLSVLNLVIVKKGENDLPGLTDTEKPRMRGPKRASKIRKLFNLSKEDDVRKYVNTYRRTFTTKSGKAVLSSSTLIFNIDGNKMYETWFFTASFICIAFVGLTQPHQIANLLGGVKKAFLISFSHAWRMQEVGYFRLDHGKKVSKAPKIQRLVTPLTLQRKRARIADKKKRIAKAKSEAAEYQKLLATRLKEQRERRSESLAKRRSKLSAASKPSVSA